MFPTNASSGPAAVSLSRRHWLAASVSLAAAPWVTRGRLFAQSDSANGLSAAVVEKKLIVYTKTPHNAEPALFDVTGHWITPLEHFFVRSHAPVPEVDTAAFRVSVEGLVDRSLSLSVSDLQAMPRTETLATLTCAGNRRSEHSAKRTVAGVQWKEGAIGNARWGGVRLAEVLKRTGIKPGAKHVWFESVDRVKGKDGGTFSFGGSIPIEKAMADHGGTPGALVTLRMNDAPLAADHGFPVRMVVPGYVGARSVKWLGRIVVSDQPSPNHYVADAYRLVTESTPLAWAESGPIYKYRLNSVICQPAASSSVRAGRVTVRGYALPPGNGETVSRVEVSADGGKSWQAAKVTGRNVPYCWVLWEASVPVIGATSELIVRATDSAGLTQPQVVPWNLKGYLFNAWHQVPVKVVS